MRKILFKILPLITVVILSSCDKLEDFGSTNNNQNATPNPITSALLTNSLSQIGGYATLSRQALYCQYFSETQYTEVSLYSTPKLTSTGNYSGILMDLQNIINYNSDPATAAAASKFGSNANQIALARVLKCYVYWYITDAWGDVPYSEALKGSPNVKYDDQVDIYEGMLQELKEAVAQFDNGLGPKGDFIYNGDVTKWKKFANSMRLIMSLRLSKRNTELTVKNASAWFAEALADPAGVIEDNADNCVINYPGGNFKNPFYAMYDGRKDYAISDEFVTYCGAGDARLGVYGGAWDGTDTYVGVPYGLARATATAFTTDNPNWGSCMAPDWRQQTSPVFVFPAAVVYLTRAEAAQLGWTTENAQTMYANGITASFGQWGVDIGVYSTTLPGGAANLAAIQKQQYIAAYPDGWFGWANWRRTGVPALSPAPDATNDGGLIPRRYTYGDNEYKLTPVTIQDAIDRLAPLGDDQDARVWWDKE